MTQDFDDLEELLEDFVGALRQTNKSKDTVDTYSRDVRYFRQYLVAHNLPANTRRHDQGDDRRTGQTGHARVRTLPFHRSRYRCPISRSHARLGQRPGPERPRAIGVTSTIWAY
ncbi:hypothetical protein AB0H58_14630 [Nocardia neocaledoniensis]|uniref:hypothetical protein n=1 Tax=Nocardia neocaledoniensis TaxID=236511 RepID=UPI0033D6FCDA